MVDAHSDSLWRLDELTEHTRQLLATLGPAQSSARVREVPDSRTIRYYTTLGLVDRPAEMRGRTAFYGPRHLLQILAIKTLQAQGLQLSRIQELLLNRSEAQLAATAGVTLDQIESSSADRTGASEPQIRESVATRRDEAFWAARSRTAASAETAPMALASGPAPAPEQGSGEATALSDQAALHSVTLAPDVTVIYHGCRVPEQHHDELRSAADALLEVLNKYRLSSGEKPGDDPS